MKNKLYKLEAIRGFAAVYVLLGHVFVHKGIMIWGGFDFSIFLRFGQEAVILFFLMSGFVIQYAFEKSKDKSFYSFLRKRFLRIYIPLGMVFLTSYFVACFENNSFLSINIHDLLGNIFMLQDVPALKQNVIVPPFMGNTPLWSLSYEWWFYMIFFFVKGTKLNLKNRTMYMLIALATISYLFYPNFVSRTFMYLLIWWIGASMAQLFSNGIKISFTTLKVELFALLGVIIILVFNILINKNSIAADLGVSSIGVSPFLELRHFSFALTAIIFVLIWNKMKWIGFNNTFGLFEPFAGISYGLYISHFFLIAEATYLEDIITNVYFRYLLYFIICFAFSYFIEKILYEYVRKLSARKI